MVKGFGGLGQICKDINVLKNYQEIVMKPTMPRNGMGFWG